jgi:hypothetical protein
MRSWRVERMEHKNTKMVLFQDINRFAKMRVSFARVATTLTSSKGAQGQRDSVCHLVFANSLWTAMRS